MRIGYGGSWQAFYVISPKPLLTVAYRRDALLRLSADALQDIFESRPYQAFRSVYDEALLKRDAESEGKLSDAADEFDRLIHSDLALAADGTYGRYRVLTSSAVGLGRLSLALALGASAATPTAPWHAMWLGFAAITVGWLPGERSANHKTPESPRQSGREASSRRSAGWAQMPSE